MSRRACIIGGSRNIPFGRRSVPAPCCKPSASSFYPKRFAGLRSKFQHIRLAAGAVAFALELRCSYPCELHLPAVPALVALANLQSSFLAVGFGLGSRSASLWVERNLGFGRHFCEHVCARENRRQESVGDRDLGAVGVNSGLLGGYIMLGVALGAKNNPFCFRSPLGAKGFMQLAVTHLRSEPKSTW